MSTLDTYEDPVTTAIRLISSNIKVIKNDGSIASIYVSGQWYDRELFKDYDAQISIGLVRSIDKKLTVDGATRQRIGTLRLNTWSTNRPQTSDDGPTMRQKICQEINRIVHQYMKTPNVVNLNYAGEGYPSGSPHKAFWADAPSELAPGATGWTELTSVQYQNIWYQDGTDFSYASTTSGNYALMLFQILLPNVPATTQQIVLNFIGYGTAPGGNGVTMKVWNASAQAWQNATTGTGSSNATVTITLTSSITNYIDSNGYVWFLVRTTNTSTGSSGPATIYCDTANAVDTVNGITYIDIVSFSDKDKVDVKPFIYRTEFLLTSWYLETIQGIF
jgi:hypothetical protein